MVNEEQIKGSLEGVLVPAVKRSIVGLNLVREVAISDKKVEVTLASTGLIIGAQDWIKDKVIKAIGTLPEVNEVAVAFIEAKPAELNNVDNIIAVMSGKGGVGKSLVASLTAVALKRQGYEVGILDADITGPSIPKMFGINTKPSGNESGMLPVLSKSGVEVMSINLLLPGSMNNVFTPNRANHFLTSLAVNSGPLSDRICSGIPLKINSSNNRSITSCEVIRLFTSTARHSLEYSSIILSMRKALPSDVLAITKS